MKSPDRAAYADITGRCIAKTEVRTVELAGRAECQAKHGGRRRPNGRARQFALHGWR